MKRIVDFNKIEKAISDDAALMARINPLETTFLEINGESRNLADCELEEILEWFTEKFPQVEFSLTGIPKKPTPAQKSSLFSQMIHVIGSYWSRVQQIPYVDGQWSEFRQNQMIGVPVH